MRAQPIKSKKAWQAARVPRRATGLGKDGYLVFTCISPTLGFGFLPIPRKDQTDRFSLAGAFGSAFGAAFGSAFGPAFGGILLAFGDDGFLALDLAAGLALGFAFLPAEVVFFATRFFAI